jgi:hypothetical protein
MCCPKGKCGCQYFILLTLKIKKIIDTGVLDFFNKKLIGHILKKIRIYSYDKIYVVVKISSFPCCVSSVSGIHPILKSIILNCLYA